MDIRVQRTNKMLFEALTKLLAKSEYDDITVSEICAESTVRRPTFYKHFDDKNDFYRAYLEYLTQDFLDSSTRQKGTRLPGSLHTLHAGSVA